MGSAPGQQFDEGVHPRDGSGRFAAKPAAGRSAASAAALRRTTTITRFAGIPTGYPGVVAGGGWSGATDELDRTVVDAAEALAGAFPGFDVEIRFNSDRRSGGAWLKTGGDGIAANALVGVNAGLAPTREESLATCRRLGIAPGSDEEREWTDGADGRLWVGARISAHALADPSIASVGRDGNFVAADREFATVAEAAAWAAEVSVVADAAEMTRRASLREQADAEAKQIEDDANRAAAEALMAEFGIRRDADIRAVFEAKRSDPDRAERAVGPVRARKDEALADARRRYWGAVASR